MQRIFIFDLSRCFGCSGCIAACINANKTPGGLAWRELHKLPPRDGDHGTTYLSMSCNHCENPPCAAGCPANALEKRRSDGIVIHHRDKCLGCRYCEMACPYDAIKWDEGAGVISKCHFCHERIDGGREPACIETCFGQAIKQTVIEHPGGDQEYEKEVPGLEHLERVGPWIRFVPNGNPRPDE
jgi:Fe-S-cluster-containing dehydrogenase component